MCKILSVLLCSIFISLFFVAHAQTINIPNANFKTKLLSSNTTNGIAKDSLGNNIKIDINTDGEIQINEILRVYRLYVGSSSISSLSGIEYFTNLQILDCFSNQITTLNVSSLINIKELHCSENELSVLNLNELRKLKILYCMQNNLTSLIVDSCSNIETLYCSGNELILLNVRSLRNLIELYCSNNKLTSLDVSSLTNLRKLYCIDNKITTLDVSNLGNLVYFHCSSNNLHTLYMKNGQNNSGLINADEFYIKFNPNLHYICADISELSILRQKTNSYGYTNTIINSFCSSSIDDAYYLLNGNIKYDNDNNGCTTSDPLLPYTKIKVKNNIDSGYVIADIQGNYVMVLDSGTYTISPQLTNNYFTVIPTSATITLPEDTIPQQFCFKRNGVHHDVSVNIVPVTQVQPGFSDAKYKIVLYNKGNQIENGTIIFNYDEAKQDYISATQAPTSAISGQLSFTFSNLPLFGISEIIITMKTNAPTDNPSVNAGDVLILSSNAVLYNGNIDEATSDNTHDIHQTVVGSFDPNDKTCLEGTIFTPSIAGKYISYNIRFENTGTANAKNIVITDFIDLNKFDITTIEVVSASHNCKTVISNSNKVQFVFENINLPFTAPNKYGYLAFKIKVKNNIAISDSLKNKANIYFDYNLPITTNTAISRIDNVTSINTQKNGVGNVNIYPNPNNGIFNIDFKATGNFAIMLTITDITGRTVLQKTIQHNAHSIIPIQENLFSSGIYLIQLKDKDNILNKKVIIHQP